MQQECIGSNVKEIRKAIRQSETGNSGKNVYGFFDGDCIRIYQVRVTNNAIEGRSLNTGEWFPLHGWETR